MKAYEKQTNNKPIIGQMAGDSRMRKMMYFKRGCNAYEGKQQSNPLSFWLEKDIWEYIKSKKLPYSPIYDMGYQRTGCIFCAFGVTMEDSPNRFQRMKTTHPKLYDYCMEKLNLDEVLTYCEIAH